MPAWPEWSLSTVLAKRPAVRVNQLGYLPNGPKRATWVTNELLPVEFAVVAAWHGGSAWPDPAVAAPTRTNVRAVGASPRLHRSRCRRSRLSRTRRQPAKPFVPDRSGSVRPARPRRFWIVLSTCSDLAYRSMSGVPMAMAIPPATRVFHRTKATRRFPPGPGQKLSGSIQDGRRPAALMCQAAGTTPEIMASTRSAAASPYGSCSTSSSCSAADPAAALCDLRRRWNPNAAGNWIGCCGCRSHRANPWQEWPFTAYTARSGLLCPAGRTRTRPLECSIGLLRLRWNAPLAYLAMYLSVRPTQEGT